MTDPIKSLVIEVTRKKDCIEVYFRWSPYVEAIGDALNHWLRAMNHLDLNQHRDQVFFWKKSVYLAFRDYVDKFKEVLDEKKVSISWEGEDGILPGQDCIYFLLHQEENYFKIEQQPEAVVKLKDVAQVSNLWTPVSEQLPEEDSDNVLVWSPFKNRCLESYWLDRIENSCGVLVWAESRFEVKANTVTHWRSVIAPLSALAEAIEPASESDLQDKPDEHE